MDTMVLTSLLRPPQGHQFDSFLLVNFAAKKKDVVLSIGVPQE